MIKNWFWTKTILCLLLIVSINNVVSAQNEATKQNKELRPPIQENFEKDEQLVEPWANVVCQISDKEVNPPGCPIIRTRETWFAASSLTLYNDDGTVWFNFSLDNRNPRHFLKNKKEEFLPFATEYDNQGITLRMVAESPNWYEVEVNEATQITKFILKSDPLWVKVTWNYLLAKARMLEFDKENKPQLYDKPNGKVIEESSELYRGNFHFLLKIEGEWALVDGFNQKPYQGWVRWRKGREMLFESKTLYKFRFNKPTLVLAN